MWGVFEKRYNHEKLVLKIFPKNHDSACEIPSPEEEFFNVGQQGVPANNTATAADSLDLSGPGVWLEVGGVFLQPTMYVHSQ